MPSSVSAYLKGTHVPLTDGIGKLAGKHVYLRRLCQSFHHGFGMQRRSVGTDRHGRRAAPALAPPDAAGCWNRPLQ